jgi:hypothetical protein
MRPPLDDPPETPEDEIGGSSPGVDASLINPRTCFLTNFKQLLIPKFAKLPPTNLR